MLHLTYAVGMVVAVGVDFPTGTLSCGGVRMGHLGGLVRKGIARGCHVVAAQRVVTHALYLSGTDVVVSGDVNLRTPVRCGNHASGQRSLAVA